MERHYHKEIAAWATAGLDAAQIYSRLLAAEVRQIADQLEPVFEETEGRDGFVALPMPAELSHDLEALAEEAIFFWTVLERKNLITLVPATEEGIGAFQQLIASGVNAGVTHLFNVRRYREVCEAYLGGMEQRLVRVDEVRHVASIAEFALGTLDHLSRGLPDSADPPQAVPEGELAVSTARVAYGCYLHSVHSDRFQKLAKAGALAQRLAWSASNGRSSLLASRCFPDEVIGPATVCELPAKTIRRLEKRSISGTGISYGLPDAQNILDRYDQFCPESEQRFTGEAQRLINEQVLRTDRAIASIVYQSGSTPPAA